jgi:2-oxoglutarate ferredoxin oxidoreductase subunit alpha
MARAGDGHRFHVTGLTHDERGYPAMSAPAQRILIGRLVDKINAAEPRIRRLEEVDIDGAEVVVVSYGITSRVGLRAVSEARAKGLKAGRLRLVTLWPFPAERIREIAGRVRAFVVPELNMGQMCLEVERASGGLCRTVSVPNPGGAVHEPEEILSAIERAAG